MGCPKAKVTGRITSITGEGLPGVLVENSTTGDQAVTDALGEYALAVPGTSPVVFQCAKTGYAPVSVRVDSLNAPEVAMWPTPSEKGVYQLLNGHYLPLTSAVPERFATEDAGVVYALRQGLSVDDAGRDAPIIMYGMPRAEWELVPLEAKDLTLAGLDGTTEAETLVPGFAVDAEIEPLDEKNRLVMLSPSGELEPGLHAIHWGALNGYERQEKQVYVFRVAGPPDADSEEQ